MKNVSYLKQEFSDSMNQSLVTLKNRISIDILNYELNLLYQSKIYNNEAEELKMMIDKISIEIDDILNKHFDKYLEKLEKIVSQIDVDFELIES